MRIADRVEALDLSMTFGERTTSIYPLLFWDQSDGATLIDTGFPGQFAALEKAIITAGVQLADIQRVIITHQDIDHIGNLSEIVQATGARVLAHAEEAPYIQGDRPLIKADPKRLEQRLQALSEKQRQQALRLFTKPPTAHVDQYLADGENLPFHGGIRVLHTPGHTPGHICIYIASCRLLVAGDELHVENGEMLGPNPENTFDMEKARWSLRKLAAMSDLIDFVLCYHGGLFGPRAGERLQVLAAV